MNEGIRMDELQRAGHGQNSRVGTKRAGGFKAQDGPDAFASSHNAIAEGLVNGTRTRILGR